MAQFHPQEGDRIPPCGEPMTRFATTVLSDRVHEHLLFVRYCLYMLHTSAGPIPGKSCCAFPILQAFSAKKRTRFRTYTVRTDFLNKAYVPPRTRVASHFSRCCGANGW
jgi:hypothetical protein